MSKAVAVGEKHLILGFKGVGFEIVPVDDSTKLMHELSILSRDPEIGVVLITESMAMDAAKAIEEFRMRSSAILAIIPAHEGSKHLSFQEMRKSVERSLGVDILGKE
jgi:V/A-type H+-transporting ATPase subunit F